jgi:hypothetical protein
MVIRKIGVMSLGKLMAVMYAGIGLLLGGLYALFAVVGGGAMMAMGGEENAALGGGMVIGMGLAAVVIAPIVYGIFGFIGGVISAFFFNLAAKYAGGLELEVQ